MKIRWPLALPLLTLTGWALATGVYQSPTDFLQEVFSGDVPGAKVLWLDKSAREKAQEILGHGFRQLRVRYWTRDGQSAWILEEIGKEEPITVGLLVTNGALGMVRVLEFRESRGWEVRYPFFTDQFNGATLTEERQLSRRIDGISGATLSVRALKKLARLALFFDQLTRPTNAGP